MRSRFTVGIIAISIFATLAISPSADARPLQMHAEPGNLPGAEGDPTGGFGKVPSDAAPYLISHNIEIFLTRLLLPVLTPDQFGYSIWISNSSQTRRPFDYGSCIDATAENKTSIEDTE